MTTQHTDDTCDMTTILSLSLLLFPSLNDAQFVVLTAFDPVMYDHSRCTEHCSTIKACSFTLSPGTVVLVYNRDNSGRK